MSKTQLYFVLAILFALAVAIFAIQNPEEISISFFVWQFSGISKVLVILASTAVGALVVMFLGLWWQFKKLKYIHQLEGEIKELKSKKAEKNHQEEDNNKEEKTVPKN